MAPRALGGAYSRILFRPSAALSEILFTYDPWWLAKFWYSSAQNFITKFQEKIIWVLIKDNRLVLPCSVAQGVRARVCPYPVVRSQCLGSHAAIPSSSQSRYRLTPCNYCGYLGYFIGDLFSVSGTRIGISAYGRQVIGIG